MKKQGFTLIEVLIVVAIIGLLSSVVLVGMGDFRKRGRDARRVADLRQVQNGLEIYYTANNAYPDVSNWDDLKTKLAIVGIPTISNDPINNTDYYYFYAKSANSQNYVLRAKLEDSSSQVLKDDGDGTILSIDCSDPIYCVQF